MKQGRPSRLGQHVTISLFSLRALSREEDTFLAFFRVLGLGFRVGMLPAVKHMAQ